MLEDQDLTEAIDWIKSIAKNEGDAVEELEYKEKFRHYEVKVTINNKYIIINVDARYVFNFEFTWDKRYKILTTTKFPLKDELYEYATNLEKGLDKFKYYILLEDFHWFTDDLI